MNEGGKGSFLVISPKRGCGPGNLGSWQNRAVKRDLLGNGMIGIRIRVYSNYWLSNRRFIVARSLRTVSSAHLIETRTSGKNSLGKKKKKKIANRTSGPSSNFNNFFNPVFHIGNLHLLKNFLFNSNYIIKLQLYNCGISIFVSNLKFKCHRRHSFEKCRSTILYTNIVEETLKIC